MNNTGSEGDTRVLEVLRQMSAAQTEHGKALEALRSEFRSLNQNATYAAGLATIARHEAETATLRLDQTDTRLAEIEQRLTSVENKLAR